MQAKTRKSICADDLRRQILTQAFAPGSYLDEAELAAHFQMSRPPLREVLNQLAGEGYVVLHKNRGAQVAPMTHKTLRNFFMAAPMIYAAVTRLAATLAAFWQLRRQVTPNARHVQKLHVVLDQQALQRHFG